jgi:hypothetical protein
MAQYRHKGDTSMTNATTYEALEIEISHLAWIMTPIAGR